MSHTSSPLATPWKPQRALIRSVKSEGPPGVSTYTLEFADSKVSKDYAFLPGQFNMIYLPGIGEAAISISSDAGQPHTLQHTVRVVGQVTSVLSRLHVGDEIGLRGPYGTAWPLEQLKGRDVIIAAGGIGLAPVRPLIYHIVKHRSEFHTVSLLYGARRPDDLLYTNEYESWRRAQIDVHLTVDVGSNAWTGQIGIVPNLFDQLKVRSSQTTIVSCGPEIMMRFVAAAGLRYGVSSDRVYLSMERNMNCAVGLCGHCLYGTEFICKDGPVFAYSRLARFLPLEDL